MADNDDIHELDNRTKDKGDGVDSSVIDELLRDPKKKELVLARLGLNDDVVTPTKKGSGKEDGTSKDSNLSQHLTPPSGKSAGAWSMPPPPFGDWWFPSMAPAPAAGMPFG